MNSKDPLHNGPKSETELFRQVSGLCNGFPNDTVVNVAANMLINAIRQTRATRTEAEKDMDELMGRTKAVLLDLHYDSTGRRKGIFPYDQHIFVPRVDLK